MGRLDPKSGKVDLVTLPTRRSNPYSIVISSDGMPFFAAFGGNRIGRLKPQTVERNQWSLPDERTRPRCIVMDADDVL